jgi:transposase
MEACATAHGWGRAISGLGHEVRLIPPIYVKPFMRRQNNDAADAEAASRPTVRFVAVKTEEQQARSMIFVGHRVSYARMHGRLDLERQ